MHYVNKTILVTICIGLYISYSAALAATSAKTNGTFSGKLAALDSTVSQRSNGFISSVKLRVKWWGLLGQPVESYSLKWRMSDYVNVPNTNAVLSRAMLSKYPTLLNRFNDLKPLDIQLKFWFGLSYNGNEYLSSSTHFNCLDNWTQSNQNAGYSCENAIGFKIVKRTPHLMIAKSGQWDDNITPSSPKDWASFVQWRAPIGGSLNKRAAETFRQATVIDFDNLEVISVSTPNREINAIYQAYLKKEEKEEADKEEQEQDDWLNSKSDANNNPNVDPDDWLNSDADTVGNNRNDDTDDWLNSDVDISPQKSNRQADFMNDMPDETKAEGNRGSNKRRRNFDMSVSGEPGFGPFREGANVIIDGYIYMVGEDIFWEECMWNNRITDRCRRGKIVPFK